MRGKVKYVNRCIWYKGNKKTEWGSHDIRFTNTYAVLYNGDNVLIDEDEIRSYYGRTRITRELINELSNDLHNVWIEYSEDEGGTYSLDDDLEDLI